MITDRKQQVQQVAAYAAYLKKARVRCYVVVFSYYPLVLLATGFLTVELTKGGVPWPFLLGSFAVILFTIPLFRSLWRCPQCRKNLGKISKPKFCPRCGAQLALDATRMEMDS